MSRRLPALPNLEHLRKQAKDLLPELQRQKPEAKLADAQHAISVEYGFTNWPALKARVEALAARSHLRGTWRMNRAKSRLSQEHPFERATLHIAVTDDTVTITDVVLDTTGRHERGVNTIRADGDGHAVEHGYVLATQWRGARVLETTVKKNGQQVSRLTYEVSPDGQNLTIAGSAAAHDGYRASEQFSVFDRVSGDVDPDAAESRRAPFRGASQSSNGAWHAHAWSAGGRVRGRRLCAASQKRR